jgi:hypothetical protein
MEMEQYVNQQNVVRFVELLHSEIDSAKRKTMKALLVEAEDKFGSQSREAAKGRITHNELPRSHTKSAQAHRCATI